MFEDIATMSRLFARARRVAVIQQPLYTYCRRIGSLMGIFTPQRVADVVTAVTMVRDHLIESGQFRHYRGSYTFLVRKFALMVMLDTLRMHFRRHQPNAFPACLAAYRHAVQLAKPAADPLETIEALQRCSVYFAPK
jgi:hypothetical protein